MSKKERDPVNRWNDAVAIANEDEESRSALEKALALSPNELDAELARDGVDVAAMNAQAGAAYDAFMAKHGEPTPEPPDSLVAGAWAARVEPPAAGATRGTRPAYAVVYGVAAAALALAGATYLATRPEPQPPVVTVADAGPLPKVEPSADPMKEVRQMRERALAACDREAFAECLAGLDAARQADPEGDEVKAVRAARKLATERLGGEKGGKEK